MEIDSVIRRRNDRRFARAICCRMHRWRTTHASVAEPGLARGLASADSTVQAAVGKLTAGAVLVVSKDGRVVHQRAFGLAQIKSQDCFTDGCAAPTGLQMHISTMFDLASVTKVMATTFATMLLVALLTNEQRRQVVDALDHQIRETAQDPGPIFAGRCFRQGGARCAASIARGASRPPRPRNVGDRRARGGVDNGNVAPESAASTQAPSMYAWSRTRSSRTVIAGR